MAVDVNKQREWFLSAIEKCALGWRNSSSTIHRRVFSVFEWLLSGPLGGCGKNQNGEFQPEGDTYVEKIAWYMKVLRECTTEWIKGKWIDDQQRFNSQLMAALVALGCDFRSRLNPDAGTDSDGFRKTQDGESLPDVKPPPSGGAGSSPSPVAPSGSSPAVTGADVKCIDGRLMRETEKEGWAPLYPHGDLDGDCDD